MGATMATGHGTGRCRVLGSRRHRLLVRLGLQAWAQVDLGGVCVCACLVVRATLCKGGTSDQHMEWSSFLE
jgi:hypothetical protein